MRSESLTRQPPRLGSLHLLVVGLILALPLLPAPSPAAADGITVLENEASYSFAQQVTFTLQATSDAEITQVYLFFRTEKDERARSVNVSFEKGREIEIRHLHDLRQFPLSPFASVSFWWQIEDAAGNRLTTDPLEFEYTDNRFQWEELSGGQVTVRWIKGQGDPAFGQAALDIAQSSLEEISAELHAPVPESTTIHIYDAQHNLNAAMVLAGREWASGQAHPDLGVVVVAVLFEDGYTSRMRRDIPHEITHLLVYQAVTPSGYKYVPEWLDEGLATFNERLPTPEYAMLLEEARTEGELLPLDTLCVPFPPDSQTAFLSYAQSASVVRFINERYGAPTIRDLLAAYAEGASCEEGVRQVLHVSLNGLENAWRASLEPQALWKVPFEQVGVWVGLWLLCLLVALPMMGRLRQR